MTWTPGPWRIIGEREDWPEGIEIGPVGARPSRDDTCLVWNDRDARLISLAPEMAEALDALVNYDTGAVERIGWLRTYGDAQARARDLLARARGEDA